MVRVKVHYEFVEVELYTVEVAKIKEEVHKVIHVNMRSGTLSSCRLHFFYYYKIACRLKYI